MTDVANDRLDFTPRLFLEQFLDAQELWAILPILGPAWV
jgi:hypothetical protein